MANALVREVVKKLVFLGKMSPISGGGVQSLGELG